MPTSFVFYQIDTIMFSSWTEFIVLVHSWPKHSTQKQLLVLFSWLASRHRRWYELKHDVLLTNCYSLQIRLAVRVCYMICFSIKAKYIQERFRISAKKQSISSVLHLEFCRVLQLKEVPYSNGIWPGLTEFGPLLWHAKLTGRRHCQLQPAT